MSPIAFLDTETTGLDPRVHVPWEVAIVDADGTEHLWCWRPWDPALTEAEDVALEVGGFAERAPQAHVAEAEGLAARGIARALDGKVIVGSKPSYDVEILTPWLRGWGIEPTWHHRPVCVATMAYGWLHGRHHTGVTDEYGSPAWVDIDLPWRSDELSRWCGVEPESFDRHTALGDARWVRAWWMALAGAEVPA